MADLAPSPLYSGERAGVRGCFANGATRSIAPHPNLSPEYGGEGTGKNPREVAQGRLDLPPLTGGGDIQYFAVFRHGSSRDGLWARAERNRYFAPPPDGDRWQVVANDFLGKRVDDGRTGQSQQRHSRRSVGQDAAQRRCDLRQHESTSSRIGPCFFGRAKADS